MLGPRFCPTNWNDGLSPLRCELRIPSAVTVVFSLNPVRDTKARSVEWQQARTPVKVYRVKVLRTRTSTRYYLLKTSPRGPRYRMSVCTSYLAVFPPVKPCLPQRLGSWKKLGLGTALVIVDRRLTNNAPIPRAHLALHLTHQLRYSDRARYFNLVLPTCRLPYTRTA